MAAWRGDLPISAHPFCSNAGLTLQAETGGESSFDDGKAEACRAKAADYMMSTVVGLTVDLKDVAGKASFGAAFRAYRVHQ